MRDIGLNYWALGDSITYGFNLSDITQRYANAIQANINNNRRSFYMNEGHTGWTSTQLLPLVQAKAKGANADIVTLLIGTNDIAMNGDTQSTWTALQNNITTMIQTVQGLKKSGVVRVYLCTTTPRFDGVSLSNAVTTIRNTATSLNVPLIDLSTILPDSSYTSDNVHPNPAGHTLIANAIWNAVLADKANWINPK